MKFLQQWGIHSEIKQRIGPGQYAALKAVNQELVGLYWYIGRMIVERQAVEGRGKAVVTQLVVDLLDGVSGVGSFSASNLWRMKAFFEAYNGLENSHHWCEKLPGATIWPSWNAAKTRCNASSIKTRTRSGKNEGK